jgi:hypothetical protein
MWFHQGKWSFPFYIDIKLESCRHFFSLWIPLYFSCFMHLLCRNDHCCHERLDCKEIFMLIIESAWCPILNKLILTSGLFSKVNLHLCKHLCKLHDSNDVSHSSHEMNDMSLCDAIVVMLRTSHFFIGTLSIAHSHLLGTQLLKAERTTSLRFLHDLL